MRLEPTVDARVLVLEDVRGRHEQQLDKQDLDLRKLTSRMDVFGTKLAIYAAIGAGVGGLFASAVAVAAVQFLIH